MRSISTTLRRAQERPDVKPYIRIYFTLGNGSHRDYTHRLVHLEHVEEPYNEWANIFLYNNDRGVDDLRGSWLQIGYGCLTDSGPQYSDTPRLWVKNQQLTSREGVLYTMLHCEGMWASLQELDVITKGQPPYFSDQYEEQYTIYDTIKDILAVGDITLQPIGDQSDGIIDVFCPKIWINESPFENPADVTYRLIAMTKCFLRPKPDMEMEVRFPQESDSVDEHYHYNHAHHFFEYKEVNKVVIPNHIVVYGNASGDPDNWDVITAHSRDEESINLYKEVTRHHIAEDINNQTDANNRASAIMTRLIFERLGGRITVPHDCRVELYDRVNVYDAR